MSSHISFRKLTQSMTEIYESILDQKLITENMQNNSILSSIKFMKYMVNIDSFVAGDVANSDILIFSFCLLML